MIPHIQTATGITCIVNGTPHLVPSDSPRYAKLKQLIADKDWVGVAAISQSDADLKNSLGRFGDVEVFRGHVTFKNQEVHGVIVDRIVEAAESNLSFEPIAAFLNNLKRNPSMRAVNDLYAWIEKNRMPLTEDGCFIAYKIIRGDWKDVYSGRFDNSIGTTVEVERNQVDEDADRTCSYGLHGCGAEYLPNFGSFGSNRRVVLIKVNPADVVAFPRDYNLSKFRCCRYIVMEEVNEEKAKSFFPTFSGYMPAEPQRWKKHDGSKEEPTEASGMVVEFIDNDGIQDTMESDDITWANVDRFRVLGTGDDTDAGDNDFDDDDDSVDYHIWQKYYGEGQPDELVGKTIDVKLENGSIICGLAADLIDWESTGVLAIDEVKIS